jgi:transcriptional regulator with XRE-family HTH domain
MMPKATALVDSLKRALKARGITYAELAQRIGMSEASVKRMFAQRNFTLTRLDDILQAADIDFAELASSMDGESTLISQLTLAQEEEIIGDPRLFVTAISALNMITPEQIVALYRLSLPEVIKYLVRLDKIGFLALLPNNRIKLLVSRTFRWIANGPIQNHFRELAAADYLDAQFDGEDELMHLFNVMLSKQSIALLLHRLRQVMREVSQQHQEDAKLPFDERHSISFLLAARRWVPRSFRALVRES